VRTIIHSGPAARLGAILLVLGPLVSWAAEFVTAAAWQQPHYSPFYNWVSHLGLTGPSQVAFGQVGNSPLGAVMDTGWVVYALLLIVGALLTFDLRQGPRPVTIVVLAILSGLGVSLVGIFQGSNADVANGGRIGLGRGRSVASIVLGIVGLVAFPVFMADVFTGWAWNIGMFERAVIYPILIGHVLLGSGLLAARQTSHGQLVAAAR
jgi:hypothetical membrane protein